MELRVECLQDPRGWPEPQAVWFGSRRVPVLAVLDRWWGTADSWCKVATAEGPYVLRLCASTRQWELAAVVRE